MLRKKCPFTATNEVPKFNYDKNGNELAPVLQYNKQSTQSNNVEYAKNRFFSNSYYLNYYYYYISNETPCNAILYINYSKTREFATLLPARTVFAARVQKHVAI